MSPLQVIHPEPPDTGVSFGGSRTLFRTAAESFGVNLSPQEDYDWLATLGAAMLIDHLLDVEQVDIVEPFTAIVSGTLREDLNPDLQIRAINYLHRQTPKRQNHIFDQVAQVNALALTQRSAANPRGVIDIRIAEADILTDVLSLDAEAVPEERQTRRSFNRWLSGWSRVGYLVDSIADLEEDFKNGASSVEPSWSARNKFMLAASKESVTAVRRTPPKLIGRCMLVGLNYVVKQRRVAVETSQ